MLILNTFYYRRYFYCNFIPILKGNYNLKKLFLLFLFFGTYLATAQEKFTLNGTLTETATGETLIGVNVIVPELQTGTMTNEYGFYSITLPEGEYEVVLAVLDLHPKE